MSAVDVMGMSVRTPGWRYTLYCAWDGAALRPKLDPQVFCAHAELFDHRQDHALWDVDNFENENLAGRPEVAAEEATLRRRRQRLRELRSQELGPS